MILKGVRNHGNNGMSPTNVIHWHFNVGPPFTTLVQHSTTTGLTVGVCWIIQCSCNLRGYGTRLWYERRLWHEISNWIWWPLNISSNVRHRHFREKWSKQDNDPMLGQCWPPSTTLAQHWLEIGSFFLVYRANNKNSFPKSALRAPV